MSDSVYNWRHWCRTCGSFEANNEIEPDLLQVAEEIFQIEMKNELFLCLDCHTYIQDFQRFLSKAQAVKEMFIDLEQKDETLDETEKVDEDLVLQMRLYYDLSLPENTRIYEQPGDTEMADDLVEIENFILEDNTDEQENIESNFIVEDQGESEADHDQGLINESTELMEQDCHTGEREETAELFDEIIYEDINASNEIQDEISENFIEEESRVEDGADDMLNHFVFRCHVCEETFNKMHFLAIHTRTLHNCSPRVACPCGKNVGSKKALQTHYKNHVQNTISFVCSQCNKSYKTETHYNNHMIAHHGEGSEAVFEKMYQCECGKSFKEARHLATHTQSHLPDEQKFIHQCSYCDKRYSSVFSLRQHIKHVHIKEPTFKCPECDKMFSRKANLESHVNHVHTVERNFECEICGLRVKTKGILRMHKKIHTTNAEDLLPCDMCQKQFKTQNQLTNHKISHSNEKRHKCILCSAQYKRSKELASHVASSHTGESKYTCRWCSKTFYNNSNFRKHKVKMHFEELESPEKKLVDDRDSTFNYE